MLLPKLFFIVDKEINQSLVPPDRVNAEVRPADKNRHIAYRSPQNRHVVLDLRLIVLGDFVRAFLAPIFAGPGGLALKNPSVFTDPVDVSDHKGVVCVYKHGLRFRDPEPCSVRVFLPDYGFKAAPPFHRWVVIFLVVSRFSLFSLVVIDIKRRAPL